ncbi:MAG TPA: hypothetical protein VMO26_03505 [Vicinamibacterales bacterium]|nr:hypothetical protein [Vicinamibacterales bacterium]
MRAVAVTPTRAARRAGIALGLLWLVLPAAAAAQSAWVPLKGEGAISLVLQNLEFGGHFDEHGEKLDGAVPSRAYIGIFHFEYALTDRVAVTARLPYVASKFTGHDDEPATAFLREQYEEFQRTHPEATGSSLDTGELYSTFQDFNLTLRYNALDRGGVAVTPVIGVTIPSHHYRTIGEAAPGQDRRALHVGVNIGRLLDPVLPNAYVHGRYTYAFVEDLLGINLDRSAAELEVGYAITPIINARALVNWARTHGGIPFSRSLEDAFLFLAHDRLLAVRYWHAGVGATVSLTDSIDLDGAWVTFLAGSDTHYGMGVSVGLTWRVLSAAIPEP